MIIWLLLFLAVGLFPIVISSLSSLSNNNKNNKTPPPPPASFTTTDDVSSSSTLSLSFRPYNPTKDFETIQNICKDVYGGTDYLPSIAINFHQDPKSKFMVLTTTTSKQQQQQDEEKEDDTVVVAVANLKQISHKMKWIEAVRTCPKYQNQGLAKQLIRKLVNNSEETAAAAGFTNNNNTEIIWSSTIESNKAMQSVFGYVGMEPSHKIHLLQFSKLAKLPGWSSSFSDQTIKPKPFVQALGLQPYISNEAKCLNNKWNNVESMEELLDILSIINRQKQKGGGGDSGGGEFSINGQIIIPGLYKILDEETILTSLRAGLIYKLQISHQRHCNNENDDDDNPKLSSSTIDSNLPPPPPPPITTTDDDAFSARATFSASSSSSSFDGSNIGEEEQQAIVVFSYDNQIQSLKSKLVCSIVATTTIAMESAIWYFGNGDSFDNDNDDNDGWEEDEISDVVDVPTTTRPSSKSKSSIFTIAVDGAIPIEESILYQKIPFVEDRCILYYKKSESVGSAINKANKS